MDDKWIHDNDCFSELRDNIQDLDIFLDAEIKKRREMITSIDNEILDKEEEEQDNENKDIIESLKSKKQEIDNVRQAILHSRKQLRKTSFKNTIMMECKELFLDTNKTLFRYLNIDGNNSESTSKSISSNESELKYTSNNESELKSTSNNESLPTIEQLPIKNTIVSPIELFVRYLVTEDQDCKENILSFTSTELVTKYNECMKKHNIHNKGNPISIIKQLNKLNINGITTGIRYRIKDKDINKTEFNKLEIKNHLCI